MNKDYKLMAMLMPIILILGAALYIFPDASNLKTDLGTPLLNQTNDTPLNQTYKNSAIENPIKKQYFPVSTNKNNYHPSVPNDQEFTSDNSTNMNPNNPTDTDLPVDHSNYISSKN